MQLVEIMLFTFGDWSFETCTLLEGDFETFCTFIIIYRKPPNISPGLIFVRKHFLVGLYMGGLIYGRAYIRIGFCVSNINHLLTFFLYNTRLI